jgi:hypothetical protein
MSAFGKALKGVQSILLLQNDVRRLQEEIEASQEIMKEFSRDLAALDKRVVRIETMIEMTTGRAPNPPQIEKRLKD